MFTREIRRTTLTSETANEIFPNITGGTYKNDVSFVATLRAILDPRIEADDSVNVVFTNSSYSFDTIKTSSKSAVFEAILESAIDPRDNKNQILIHSLVNGSDEDNSATIQYIRENIESQYEGYRRLEDLSLFVKKLVEADFYINENLQNTIIIANQLEVKKVHMIQSLIPRLVPWYFKETPELSDAERALLISLTKTSAIEYQELIEEFSKRYDFRSLQIKKQLHGFESVFEKRQLREIERAISDIEQNLLSLESRYSEHLKRRDEKMMMRLGLVQKIEETNDSEIMEYFLCNKTLHLVNVTDTRLEFISEAYLDNYDPEMFDRIVSNERSVFYRNDRGDRYNDKFSDEDIKLLLSAIWGDEASLKIKVCAAYKVDLGEKWAEGISGYHFPTSFENHLPNQHIQRHSCLGNNGMYIQKCLGDNDYILAIEQCVASARNFNMADGVVAEEFMQNLFAPSAKKIIELPDGTSCTPIRALEWLKGISEKDGEEK